MSQEHKIVLPVTWLKSHNRIDVFRDATYLNVAMLPELRMASGGLFQTDGTAEEKGRAAVLVCDFGTVSKSISTDISPQRGTYGSNEESK